MFRVLDFTVVVLFIEACLGSGLIEITFMSYASPKGFISTDKCCDSPSATVCPANECDPFFVLCVKDLHYSACQLGNTTTNPFTNTDYINFNATQSRLDPLIFPFLSWPGRLILQITVMDSNTGVSDEKIDYYQQMISVVPDQNGTIVNYFHRNVTGKLSRLDVMVNVRCDENFYGDDCLKYCAPDAYRTCSPDGDEQCVSGPSCPTVTTPTYTTKPVSHRVTTRSSTATTTSRINLSSTMDIKGTTTPSSITSAMTPSAATTSILLVTSAANSGGINVNISLPTNLTDLLSIQQDLRESIGQLTGLQAKDIDFNITELHRYGSVREITVSAIYKGNGSFVASSILKSSIQTLVRLNPAALNKESSTTRISIIPVIVGSVIGAVIVGLVATLLVWYILKRKKTKIDADPTDTEAPKETMKYT